MNKNESNERTPQGRRARQKRRYVRLEIFSPVEFATIQLDDEKRARLHPEKKAGILLNLSGGGALISTTDTAVVEELVLMRFDIKGFDSLTDILCRVKRVEESSDGERLVGVQFLSPDELEDRQLAAALSRLTAHPRGFEEGISRLISRYVFQRQVDSESDQ